jgi:hypothetical protein
MDKLIKSKLLDISSEVKEFHPLLETLFSKFQNISNVDYTHGINEKGADFVLTRIDELFGETEYIGVIAKIGVIKQNTSDIDRQIEECDLKRYTAEGKKEILLSEIWIVSNGIITNNAKEKIFHKYSTRKIKFVPLSKLVKLIEKFMPNYGANISLEFGEYLHNLKIENAEMEERTSLLPVENRNLYLEQTLEKIEINKYEQKKKKFLRSKKEKLLEVIDKYNFLIVEGQMGSGKTKLIRRTVDHLTDPEVFIKLKLQPISISYKEFITNYKGSINDLIEQTNENFKLGDYERKYFIFIDGIDEVKQKANDRVESILGIYEQTQKLQNVIVLITSRPIENPELESKFKGIISRYELSPLSMNKVIKFIESICSSLNIKNRIIEDLKNSPLFRSLPRTPIATILLAKLMNEEISELPSNMTELFKKYMELSLGRWDIEKGLQSQKEFEALMSIVPEIAVYMVDNEIYKMASSEVKKFFDNYLDNRNLGIEPNALFEKLINRCDILCFNEKYGTVSFKHKTFAEYFYAFHLTKKNSITLTENVYDPYWMNIYFFLFGLKTDCPELLSELINISTTSEAAKIIRMINLGNFLLAAYTTPYKVIEAGIKSVFIDAVDYYEEIISKKIDSPFNKIPEMHLLSLFRTLLKQSYSYSFFYNAIEKFIKNADKLNINDDKKALLFFFLYMSYVEIGGIALFDDLIKKFGPKLPIPVQLAIYHEAEYYNDKTNGIKKMEKRIRRSLKGNKSFADSIDKLYKQPIGTLSIT